MTDSPFGDSGFDSGPQQQVAQQGGGSSKKVILSAIGALFVIAGFVWKLFLGNVDTGGVPEEAVFLDYAWLILVVLGGALVAFALKKSRR